MSKLTLPCLKQEGRGEKEKEGEKTNVWRKREGGERSAAVGCYSRSVHPSLSVCGSSGAEGVEVDWLELALTSSQQ